MFNLFQKKSIIYLVGFLTFSSSFLVSINNTENFGVQLIKPAHARRFRIRSKRLSRFATNLWDSFIDRSTEYLADAVFEELTGGQKNQNIPTQSVNSYQGSLCADQSGNVVGISPTYGWLYYHPQSRRVVQIYSPGVNVVCYANIYANSSGNYVSAPVSRYFGYSASGIWYTLPYGPQ